VAWLEGTGLLIVTGAINDWDFKTLLAAGASEWIRPADLVVRQLRNHNIMHNLMSFDLKV
jgi:hypothetical protein